MRLNKWIMGGLLGVGLVFTGARHASAYTSADLQGTWTGTFTPQRSPTPLLVTPSGTTDYNAPAGFFDPEPVSFNFATSQQFAFGFDFFNAAAPPGTSGFLPVTQTGASFNADAFTADENVFVPLANGKQSEVGTEVFNGTIQLDAADPQELVITGTWDITPTVLSLPSNATEDFITATSDFSLTKAVVAGPSSVPLPPAALSALAMLGGLAAFGAIRSRLRVAQR